ncbi:hypothetical protein D3C73_1262400 [compost metagenome]
MFKADVHNLDIILNMADFIPQFDVLARPFEVVAHHSAQPGQGIGDGPLVLDFRQHFDILQRVVQEVGIDLVMQRTQLSLFGQRLLIDSLGHQRINGIHQLVKMMCQLPHLTASADRNSRVGLAPAHLLHRFRQPAQILQDEGIHDIGNRREQKDKADIGTDQQVTGM